MFDNFYFVVSFTCALSHCTVRIPQVQLHVSSSLSLSCSLVRTFLPRVCMRFVQRTDIERMKKGERARGRENASAHDRIEPSRGYPSSTRSIGTERERRREGRGELQANGKQHETYQHTLFSSCELFTQPSNKSRKSKILSIQLGNLCNLRHSHFQLEKYTSMCFVGSNESETRGQTRMEARAKQKLAGSFVPHVQTRMCGCTQMQSHRVVAFSMEFLVISTLRPHLRASTPCSTIISSTPSQTRIAIADSFLLTERIDRYFPIFVHVPNNFLNHLLLFFLRDHENRKITISEYDREMTLKSGQFPLYKLS